MTGLNWLLVLAFVGGSTFLLVWLKRRTRQTVAKFDEQSQREFEVRRTRLSGIGTLVMGAAFETAMFISWRRVPTGNEPFAVGFMAFGFAAILYGVFKLYKLRPWLPAGSRLYTISTTSRKSIHRNLRGRTITRRSQPDSSVRFGSRRSCNETAFFHEPALHKKSSLGVQGPCSGGARCL